jgi:hypothetical protein
LASRLKANGHVPPGRSEDRPWAPEEEALLGTDRNAVIAKRLGRSRRAVAWHRLVIGVPGSLVPVNGLAIERLRIAKGWSRPELAERVGVKYETVWQIEPGRRERTDRLVLGRVASALGLARSAVMGIEPGTCGERSEVRG